MRHRLVAIMSRDGTNAQDCLIEGDRVVGVSYALYQVPCIAQPLVDCVTRRLRFGVTTDFARLILQVTYIIIIIIIINDFILQSSDYK